MLILYVLDLHEEAPYRGHFKLGYQFQEEFSQGEYPQGQFSQGGKLGWKYTFSIDDKGRDIYQMKR